jgi:hypothetical protein
MVPACGAMWHVEDTAALYRVVVEAIASRGGEACRRARRAFCLGGNRLHSWRDVSQGAADACFDAGKIADRIVLSIPVADVTKAAAAELNGTMGRGRSGSRLR